MVSILDKRYLIASHKYFSEVPKYALYAKTTEDVKALHPSVTSISEQSDRLLIQICTSGGTKHSMDLKAVFTAQQ